MKKIFSAIFSMFRITWRFLVWYFSLYRGRRWYTKLITGIVSFIVFIFLFFGMVDINFLFLFGSSPGFFSIAEPEVPIASEIYSADGVMIGKFYSENRTPVKYNDINDVFWKALIDTEDERFYQHHGVDPEAFMGAAKDAVLKQRPRGASTITQQLAKNLFHMREKGSKGLLTNVPGLGMLITKTKEWIVATKLEIMYEKEEILLMYANTVEFGSNTYGIKTAAKTYFNKTPKELTTEECAVLVAMLKATTTYNPRINPENSKKRRNVVLNLMYMHGHLSKEECDSLQRLPLKLSYNAELKPKGQAQYFCQAVYDELQTWCEEEGYDLNTDGLKIYTTIDTRMQKYAERAAINQMKQIQRDFNKHWDGEKPWRDENGKVIPNFIEEKAEKLPVYEYLYERFDGDKDSIEYYLNKKHKVKLFDYAGKDYTIERKMSTLDSLSYMVRFMHCGFVAIEPQSGYVKAWVGDVDFNTWQYDKVRAMRQPGSTFKLFVYTTAMEQGFTPCVARCDEYFRETTWDKVTKQQVIWEPKNANGKFSGDSLTLKTAFAKSVNSIAVRLGKDLGIEQIAQTAYDMGILDESLEVTPAMVLGASDVKLIEMANAYATVANNGRHIKPVLVTRIVDNVGDEVYVDQSEGKKSISPTSAFYMQTLLMAGLTEPGGTSQAMRQYVSQYFKDTDFGGKTGTTNNNSDGWYMCVTPNLVCGAWVGGEYRSIHFRTAALGQGSRTALPICGEFMRAVLGDKQFRKYHGRFSRPDNSDISDYKYNCTTVVRKERKDTTRRHVEPIDSLGEDEEFDGLDRDFDDEHDYVPDNDQTATERREGVRKQIDRRVIDRVQQELHPNEEVIVPAERRTEKKSKNDKLSG